MRDIGGSTTRARWCYRALTHVHAPGGEQEHPTFAAMVTEDHVRAWIGLGLKFRVRRRGQIRRERCHVYALVMFSKTAAALKG